MTKKKDKASEAAADKTSKVNENLNTEAEQTEGAPPDGTDETDGSVVEGILLRADTLVGNVRDVILDTIRHEKENKAWAQMTEDEQQALIDRATRAAELLVKETVGLVASRGFNTMRATVEKYASKDRELTITIKAVETQENLLALYGNTGQFVNLTFANDDAFDQDRPECEPDPDQADLGLDADEDFDADTGEVSEAA